MIPDIKPKLVSVHIQTHGGDEYVFPGMDIVELRQVLPESGRMPDGQPTLSLINANVSVIAIVFRVIKRIYIRWPDGVDTTETLWICPA